MSFSLKKLTTLFHKPGSSERNPARDWLMLLGVAALFLIVSVGWNIWFFNKVVDEGITADGGEGSALEAHQADVVKRIFESRATTSAEYRSYPFVDPSR